jgi:DNA primase
MKGGVYRMLTLNSVSNLQKAFSFLSRYDGICCCLDNDTAGKNAVQALKDKYGIRICDLSHEYSEYKDLNEYLCGKNNQLHI